MQARISNNGGIVVSVQEYSSTFFEKANSATVLCVSVGWYAYYEVSDSYHTNINFLT